MTWPSTDVPTTNANAGTDNPQVWREDALDLTQKVNQMRDHLSALAGGVAVGTWAPTVSNVTNTSAPVLLHRQYIRLGGAVLVAVAYQVSTTAAGGTSFNLSLPVPADLTFSTQFMGAGVATGSGGVQLPVRGLASSTSDTLGIVFTAAAADTYTVVVTGIYTGV